MSRIGEGLQSGDLSTITEEVLSAVEGVSDVESDNLDAYKEAMLSTEFQTPNQLIATELQDLIDAANLLPPFNFVAINNDCTVVCERMEAVRPPPTRLL